MLTNCAGGALMVGACMMRAQGETGRSLYPPDTAILSMQSARCHSTLQPFDKIKKCDFQPAIEAGMVSRSRKMEQIGNLRRASIIHVQIGALGPVAHAAMNAFTLIPGANTIPSYTNYKNWKPPS